MDDVDEVEYEVTRQTVNHSRGSPRVGDLRVRRGRTPAHLQAPPLTLKRGSM